MTRKSHLPTGWTTLKLEDIKQQCRSTVDPSKAPESRYVLYSVPSFPSQVPEHVFGKEIGSTKHRVATGDVLICKINPRINRVWVVDDASGGELIASTEWVVFTPGQHIASRYVRYALMRESVRDFLASNVSGVGGSLTRVSPSVVGRLEIPLAPLTEQRRIVAAIEQQFTRLDAAVASLKCARANLKRYRAAVLQAAVNGSLGGADEHANESIKPLGELLVQAEYGTSVKCDYAAQGLPCFEYRT